MGPGPPRPANGYSVGGGGGHLRREAGRANAGCTSEQGQNFSLVQNVPTPRDLPSQFIGQRVERPRSHWGRQGREGPGL